VKNQVSEWNEIFLNCGDEKPKYDDWLNKFENALSSSKNKDIIDLGCGFGNDTLYLSERGYTVISCDYSIEALNRLDKFIKEPKKKLFNMLEGLPFEDNSASVLISDLSLHYFSWEDTKRIVNEISRVLENRGYLICRLNSTKDYNFGAGMGVSIEQDYYNVGGKLKRFFNKSTLESLFQDSWLIHYIKECEMHRYKEIKIVWELLVENRKL
jgi:ubiquinone/menaquinone biosynthesis C-methylase UbiE